MRFKAHLKKSAPTLPGLFDDAAPKSRLCLKLTEKYRDLAARRIVTLLLDNVTSAGIEYERLFGEAMSFPLVTPEDLAQWLKAMKSSIRIEFSKSPKRPNPNKPSPFENDRVIVIDRRSLSCWSREAKRS